jgi:hypothetical protein
MLVSYMASFIFKLYLLLAVAHRHPRALRVTAFRIKCAKPPSSPWPPTLSCTHHSLHRSRHHHTASPSLQRSPAAASPSPQRREPVTASPSPQRREPPRHRHHRGGSPPPRRHPCKRREPPRHRPHRGASHRVTVPVEEGAPPHTVPAFPDLAPRGEPSLLFPLLSYSNFGACSDNQDRCNI